MASHTWHNRNAEKEKRNNYHLLQFFLKEQLLFEIKYSRLHLITPFTAFIYSDAFHKKKSNGDLHEKVKSMNILHQHATVYR